MTFTYRFEFTDKAEREFIVLDQVVQKRIFKKISFWEISKNPLTFAKSLHGVDRTYRFRIGDYRLLVRPDSKGQLVILFIVKVGHRREVYE